jgi:hypothetical protein
MSTPLLDTSNIADNDLVKVLQSKGYVNLDNNAVTLRADFYELMFATFLAYFSNARMKRVKEEKGMMEERYTFFPLDKITIFARQQLENTVFPFWRLTTENAMPNKIFSEDKKEKFLAKYSLLYNMTKNGICMDGKVVHEKVLENVSTFDEDKEIPSEIIMGILQNNITESDLGRILDCKVLKINIPFQDIQQLIEGNTEYYEDNFGLEKIFIQLLGLCLFVRLHPDRITASTYLEEPHISNEMDIVFYMGDKFINLEFSCTSNMDDKYIKKKLVNYHLIKSQHAANICQVIAFTGKQSIMNNDGHMKRHIDNQNGNIKIIPIKEKYTCPSDTKWIKNGFEQLRDMFNDLIKDIEAAI